MVIHFGLPCGSWVALSRGTTGRCFLGPLGDVTVACARTAYWRYRFLRFVSCPAYICSSNTVAPEDGTIDLPTAGAPGDFHAGTAVLFLNFSTPSHARAL